MVRKKSRKQNLRNSKKAPNKKMGVSRFDEKPKRVIKKTREKTQEEDDVKLTPDRKEQSDQINWFPGHMAKAARKVKEKLHLVDIVLEVRDARCPIVTSNPELDEIIGDKARLVVFNKANLADPKVNKEWEAYYKEQGLTCLFINALDKNSIKQVPKLAHEIALEKQKENGRQTISNAPVRMMIVGLPNIGKSTMINRMAKKGSMRIGNKPGVTQTQQWIHLENNIELLDTPGIMPKKIQSVEKGLWLCSIHAIRDEIVGEERVALYILDYLLKKKSKYLTSKYEISDFQMGAPEALVQVCKARNFLRKKAQYDFDRGYKTVLLDFRSGELGPCSFERP